MTITPPLWVLLRIIVILLASWGITSYDAAKSNVDWLACLLISTALGVSLFLWLFSMNNRQPIDCTKPISISYPFMPMRRYPIRYWLVAATALISGGSAALLKETTRGAQHMTVGASFVCLGIGILLAIGLFVRLCKATN